MRTQVSIRPSHSEDERAARGELVRQTWEIAYREIFSRAEIRRVFEGSLRLAGDWTARRTAPGTTLVAEDQGRLVGVAGLGFLEPGVGELAALYVLPGHQGKGIGLQLWEAALAELRAMGCATMEVWTLARAEARSFYEARGCLLMRQGVLRLGAHAESVLGYRLDLSEQPGSAHPPGEPRAEGYR